MSSPAQTWIRDLGLQPHPEGGWFRETYRSAEGVEASALPPRYGARRSLCTSIFFLLEGHQFSALHRLRSDELWHYHAGDALTVWVLHPSGALRVERVGTQPPPRERLQLVLPAGCWFGARPAVADGFSLIGCTVAPGFEFADFELADRAALTRQYPQHRDVIASLTRTP